MRKLDRAKFKVNMNNAKSGLKKVSVLYKLIFSNLVLLIIPMLLIILILNIIESETDKNQNISNSLLCHQLLYTTDNIINEVKQLSEQIASDITLNVLLETDNVYSSAWKQNLLHVQDVFKGLSKNKREIYDFYVYMRHSDTILTPNMKTDSSMFYNYVYKFDGLSYNDWLKELNPDNSLCFIPARQLITPTLSANVITYIQALPFQNPQANSGQLVVLVNEDEIREYIKSIESINGTSVYIQDEKNNVIMSLGNEHNPTQLLDAASGHNDSIILSSVRSDSTGWTYSVLTDKKVYFRNTYIFKKMLWILLILCLLIEISGIIILSYKNYIPLKKLLSDFDIKNSGTHNEYELINNQILNLNHLISSTYPMARNNYLVNLLKGYPTGREQYYELNFNYDEFYVVTLSIDDVSFSDFNCTSLDFGMITYAIDNISNEIADKEQCCYTVRIENDVSALIFCSFRDANTMKFITKLQELIARNFNILISIGVSNPVNSKERISEAYRQAITALEYKYMFGVGSIITYSQLMPVKNNFSYSLTVETQFMNYIKSGDKENVRLFLEDVYNSKIQSSDSNLEMCRCLMFSIAGTLMKLIESLGIPYQDIFDETPEAFWNSFSGNNFSMAFSRLIDVAEKATDYINNSKKNHSTKLIEQILEYVNSNYCNPSININLIAETCNISSPYLSSFFKNSMGQNINNYIVSLRLEKSKALLTDTNMTLFEIATAIGYTSDTVFIRTFKKAYGITPGKYRQINSTQTDE